MFSGDNFLNFDLKSNCVSYFFTFPKCMQGIGVTRFALPKTVNVDTMFPRTLTLTVCACVCVRPCAGLRVCM